MKVTEMLASLPLFAELDAASLADLAGHTTEAPFSAGDALLHEGDPSEAL